MYYSNWPSAELKPNPELQSLKKHSRKELITAICGKATGKYATHDEIVGDTHKTCLCFEKEYVYERTRQG
jgi:hypothetical protein